MSVIFLSKIFIAFSVSIIRLVEYVVSGFSMQYCKPRFNSVVNIGDSRILCFIVLVCLICC